MTVAKPLVFISHIHEEAELATTLSTSLSSMLLGGVDFFVSSDRQSIRGGDDWLVTIKDALSNACIVVVLVSPRSINRTWISFEAGAGWLRRRVVPLCHSGMQPSQLPNPLQRLYSFDIEVPHDLRDLCQLVAEAANLHVPEGEWGQLSKQLKQSALGSGSPIVQPYGASSCWVFPTSEDLRTITSLEKSLNSCEEAWLFAIGLNFCWNASYFQLLEDRISKAELRVQICMANFRSQVIINRLEDEPEHPIGILGSEHLVKRLMRLEDRINDRARFSLNLFSHYPTYAMLIFDEEIYVYPYGFNVLGNSSPTFYWKGKDPAIQFFKQQFILIWDQSTPATEIYGQSDEQG